MSEIFKKALTRNTKTCQSIWQTCEMLHPKSCMSCEYKQHLGKPALKSKRSFIQILFSSSRLLPFPSKQE